MVISGARHVSKDSKPVHCVELFWSQRSWVLTKRQLRLFIKNSDTLKATGLWLVQKPLSKCLGVHNAGWHQPWHQCFNAKMDTSIATDVLAVANAAVLVFELMVNIQIYHLQFEVPKRCRFIKNGCSAIVEGFNQHEVNCQFSENYCVLSYCPEIVPLSKLLTHILNDCSLTSEIVDSTDPRKFKDTRCDEITVPCVHEGKLNYDRGCVNILKLDADKYFLFCCIPQWTLSRFLIYTYFIGVPEEAKQYHFTLKLKSQKDGQTLERKSPVISATT